MARRCSIGRLGARGSAVGAACLAWASCVGPPVGGGREEAALRHQARVEREVPEVGQPVAPRARDEEERRALAAGGEEPAYCAAAEPEADEEPSVEPRRLGSMWNTYYVLSEESDFRGARNTPLYDTDCKLIGRVRARFHDDLCMQGSGVLEDGRVVNFGRRCTRFCPAAPTCRESETRVCFLELDERFPHGMGAGVPLVPARSVAVDPRRVALGSWLYLEELDGVAIPGSSKVHDGCVRAEDTGGGIRDDHFDLFAGTRTEWRAWERILPTRSRFTVWADHPRCVDKGGPPTRLPPFVALP